MKRTCKHKYIFHPPKLLFLQLLTVKMVRNCGLYNKSFVLFSKTSNKSILKTILIMDFFPTICSDELLCNVEPGIFQECHCKVVEIL